MLYNIIETYTEKQQDILNVFISKIKDSRFTFMEINTKLKNFVKNLYKL